MEQYIDKSALVAEIENIESSAICEYKSQLSRYSEGCLDAIHRMKSFLNTLEVKEVDLEKEIKKYIKDNICGYCVPGTEETAKYFFELGLKAHKMI